jgi:cell division septation protein DedD
MTTQPMPERSVAVGGDIRDSILVLGDNNVLEIALGNDAILRRLLDEGEVRIQRRARPRTTPPPPFPDHLDREAELGSLAAAAGHVNVHGTAGIGKTYVLLAALGGEDVVYVDAAGRALDDVLQAVCEELFDFRPPLVLTPERRRHELREVAVEIALDGVRLAPDDAQRLLLEAPHCRYLVSSRRRVLQQALSVRVAGLPADAAQELIATELRRPLDPGEQVGARRLIEVLGGHPLRLRQAAGLVADTGVGLADLADSLATEDPVHTLSTLLRAPLELEDRELVEELAAAGGAPLGSARLADIAGNPLASERLAALETRHLVQSHSPRYSLVGALAQAPEDERLDKRREHAAITLAEWAERSAPAAVLEEAPALLELLRWARERGRHLPAQRLARALDRPLALGRRWAAWRATLLEAREAAAASGDAYAESWALHQLGTRAYALGSADESVALLEQALAQREAIGDTAGAAATRHNLEFIRGGGPGGDDTGADDNGGGRGPWARVAIALTIAAAIAVGGAVVALGGDDTPADRPETTQGSVSEEPTAEAEAEPTAEPTAPTTEPTAEPTEPTTEPTEPTAEPTEPTAEPTEPTTEPTTEPVPTVTTDGSGKQPECLVLNACIPPEP